MNGDNFKKIFKGGESIYTTLGSDAVTKSGIGLIAGVFAYLRGEINELLVVLAVFMVCDYVSGTVLALAQGKFSVKKGMLGAVKKLFYLFLVLMGFMIDFLLVKAGAQLGLSISTRGAFGMAINCYLIGTEGLSVIESLAALGLPIPKFLKKALGLIRDGAENIRDENRKE